MALAVNNEIEEGKFTDKCVKMKVDHVSKKKRPEDIFWEFFIFQVVSLLQFDQKFKGSMLYTAVVEMTKPSKAVYKVSIY